MNTNLYYKKFILVLISLAILIVYINIGENKYFLFSRTADNLENVAALVGDDIDVQKQARYGGQYYACSYIKKYCEERGIKDPYVLFEPNSYYSEKKIKFKAPEPIIFYYFTGLKGLWMDSEHVNKASLFVIVNNQEFSVVPINSQQERDDILHQYKQYKTSL